MNNLKQLQQEFLTALQNPQAAAVFSQRIKTNKKLSSTQQLAIYHDSIQENLLISLLNNFSICEQLIGHESFRGLAELYIKQTPATSPDLGEYGASFSVFIANYPPAKILPYLAEMARLEWECWQTWQRPKTKLVDPQALAQVPAELQENIVFSLPENATLFNSIYPVAEIWQLHQTDNFTATTLNWQAEAYPALITRINQSEIILLTLLEWQLLTKITDKIPLGKLSAVELELLPALMAKHCLGNFTLAVD